MNDEVEVRAGADPSLRYIDPAVQSYPYVRSGVCKRNNPLLHFWD